MTSTNASNLPRTFRNTRERRVHQPIAHCLNEAGRHSVLIEVSAYHTRPKVLSFERLTSAPNPAGSEVTHVRNGKGRSPPRA